MIRQISLASKMAVFRPRKVRVWSSPVPIATGPSLLEEALAGTCGLAAGVLQVRLRKSPSTRQEVAMIRAKDIMAQIPSILSSNKA